jgi:hypothetical protein
MPTAPSTPLQAPGEALRLQAIRCGKSHCARILMESPASWTVQVQPLRERRQTTGRTVLKHCQCGAWNEITFHSAA